MKRFLLIFFIVAIAVAGGWTVWLAPAINSVSGEGPLPADKIVLIERGMGVSAIAARLAQENVVTSALLFKIAAYFDEDKRPLKAGEYQFAAHTSLRAALTTMREGKVYDRKVTFPEGVTSWQIVQTLTNLTDMSGEISDTPPEGTLLPETYHYVGQADRAALLAGMAAAMTRQLDALWEGRAQNLPFETREQAVTLASIVEKETGVAAERPRIAGVFVNRLRQGIPLQSDPTVIYALTAGEIKTDGQGPLGRHLLSRDLTLDSPYNTYLYPGLPPGPIANPGRAALEAVLHPEDNDYLYFVADGSGGHVFAKTLTEHNRNVARWRSVRRQNGN